MNVKFRDYYAFVSMCGLVLSLHGFFRLTGTPQYEIVGGSQMVAGFFIGIFGLLLLKGDAESPGFIETLVDKLMLRCGVSSK